MHSRKPEVMSVRESYNQWALQYDTDPNKTRDMEAIALRSLLKAVRAVHCLEFGCGTGKNTEILAGISKYVTAVDVSEEMLRVAMQKVKVTNVEFIVADLNGNWDFVDKKYDLVVFSLVLEHIKDLDSVFNRISGVVPPGANVYIGELHPYRQYTGSKARFETGSGLHSIECYTHNISDFVRAGERSGFALTGIDEFFDGNNRGNIPRILALLFSKINDDDR
jgi:ubiquinone/menaquinone biosynthesis C-methylase UbiE